MFSKAMFKHIRIIIILATLAAILFKFITGITAMNKIKDEGETLLLKLRPVDPRALMLGDYMALAYDRSAFPKASKDLAPQGTLILNRDDHNVGTFGRIDDNPKMTNTEIRVKYALKRSRADFGSARYYFQEGTAESYEEAEYGVFKVSPTGHMILVALADEDYKIIAVETAVVENP